MQKGVLCKPMQTPVSATITWAIQFYYVVTSGTNLGTLSLLYSNVA